MPTVIAPPSRVHDIAHSERTPTPLRAQRHTLHGMQTWVALPKSAEETAPAFHQHAASLPQQRCNGFGYGRTPAAPTARNRRSRCSPARRTWRRNWTWTRRSTWTRVTWSARCRTERRGATGRRRHPRALPAARTGRARPAARQDRAEGDVDGRRAAGRAAPPVMELRVQLHRAHRTGQAGLARRPLRADPRRGPGMHPTARTGQLASAGATPLAPPPWPASHPGARLLRERRIGRRSPPSQLSSAARWAMVSTAAGQLRPHTGTRTAQRYALHADPATDRG
ncbi:hypothetical protein XTALMG727_2939 [Xanthomonas translucens pv. arrhenatheri LMG 727]|uniref:Uncharacterized protein n=1 Tax=Xanthomonas graminis pv. arrhenatheri LMG 727 TaxID=1195923 RepID=A0A0K3A3F5_9XANT|nr:hypothetical protein XTALMG727_2939 [Xanthomonas translucens pv. arrhenatheri LMG 727]